MKKVGLKLKCDCHGEERYIVKNHPRKGLLCWRGVDELKEEQPKKEPDWKKKCWDWFSKYIRLKYADDQGMEKCFTCNRRDHWKKFDCGHGIPRVFSATFIDERNNHPQCFTCNKVWEGRKDVYKVEVDKKYGAGTWDKLEVLAQSKCHRTQFDYKILYLHYKQEFEKLQCKNKAA